MKSLTLKELCDERGGGDEAPSKHSENHVDDKVGSKTTEQDLRMVGDVSLNAKMVCQPDQPELDGKTADSHQKYDDKTSSLDTKDLFVAKADQPEVNSYHGDLYGNELNFELEEELSKHLELLGYAELRSYLEVDNFDLEDLEEDFEEDLSFDEIYEYNKEYLEKDKAAEAKRCKSLGSEEKEAANTDVEKEIDVTDIFAVEQKEAAKTDVAKEDNIQSEKELEAAIATDETVKGLEMDELAESEKCNSIKEKLPGKVDIANDKNPESVEAKIVAEKKKAEEEITIDQNQMIKMEKAVSIEHDTKSPIVMLEYTKDLSKATDARDNSIEEVNTACHKRTSRKKPIGTVEVKVDKPTEQAKEKKTILDKEAASFRLEKKLNKTAEAKIHPEKAKCSAGQMQQVEMSRKKNKKFNKEKKGAQEQKKRKRGFFSRIFGSCVKPEDEK